MIRFTVAQALVTLACLIACLMAACSADEAALVSFGQSAPALETYDILEITATVSGSRPANPFTNATLRGVFEKLDGGQRWDVAGFADSSDGRLFRIRFMPPARGNYRYRVEYAHNGRRRVSSGIFQAEDAGRRGPIRVDPSNRWHFVWEGTGEHYFFNGTTAYWLAGWRDDRIIEAAIERLHALNVNRIRVTLAGRTNVYWGEPVMAARAWTPFVGAWPSLTLEDVYHPGFDYRRFDVVYWQKFDRLLRFARDRDVVISVVLDMNDSVTHPVAGSGDELRFIRYAVDRFASFSNVTWDLGDDTDHYRDDQWMHETGSRLKQWDPYRHLATNHPVDNAHQDRTSDWFDFTSLQEWSRNQHVFMLAQRNEQRRLGRIIPQTNEEYGYEDHYPLWVQGIGSDSADTLRRTAWDIVMAGGYQTTGETARRGTNIWPDTGGGWMNGRGDETMTMLRGYAHIVEFFTSFAWWKTEPHDELVNPGNYCLALPGQIYAVYLPHGGSVTLRPEPGHYSVQWFEATTGATIPLPAITPQSSISLEAPSNEDWALLIRRATLPSTAAIRTPSSAPLRR